VPQLNYYIPMGIGGLFVIVGLAMVLWGRRGGKKYYESISSKTDVREFLEQWPRHLGYDSIKLGGWISIVIGVILLALAGIFSQLD